MTAVIGWYIHHHGNGHLTRLLAVAPWLEADIHCFSSLPRPAALPPNCAWTTLDRDDGVLEDGRDPATADPTANGMLHWSPLTHAGHRDRLATIVASVARHPVDAFVVDVSVEVALLVRLLGIRTVVIAQPGRRDDPPHQLAYRSASSVIAPWPGRLLDPPHLRDARGRTVFTGGITRFEDRAAPAQHERGEDVVLLVGGGGDDLSPAQVDEAARTTGRRWRVRGRLPGATWTDDPWADLAEAHVVVTWAGQNAVADLAAAGARAVVIPQARPFDEQMETALVLEGGLAIVRRGWPAAADWPALLDSAALLRPQWSQWQVAGAARRAAETILETARGSR